MESKSGLRSPRDALKAMSITLLGLNGRCSQGLTAQFVSGPAGTDLFTVFSDTETMTPAQCSSGAIEWVM
jgi:hypothetical protein